MIDLFGDSIDPKKAIHVNIYSDEIWQTKNKITSEVWIYSVAIYERLDKPILEDLINLRYLKDKEDWESRKEENDTDIHWVDFGKDANKKFIIERWLKFIQDDCFSDRKFYFSLTAINLTNLNIEEFSDKQKLNSIYNRFFRSMLQYSLKKFFGSGVVVENIYHEEGSQQEHDYFDWHTIFKLDQDEHLNFKCERIEFLPKSHRDNPLSNILELCDILAGIYKDIHCGIFESKKNENKREILNSNIVQELLIKRIIRQSRNTNSKYGHSNRFHLSFFPKINSVPGSIIRSMDNYYDISKIDLAFEHNPNQSKLF
ncbi:MAG: hypothetical protein ABL917_00145 [Parcubacteria group bacterium]